MFKDFIEFIKKIKEWYKNPKYKSLVQLGFCMFFLIFIIIIFRIDSNMSDTRGNYNSKDGLNNNIIGKYFKYDFKYEFLSPDNSYEIIGTNNNKIITYSEDYNDILFSEDQIKKITTSLDLNNLYEVSLKSEILYKTEYSNGDKDIAYQFKNLDLTDDKDNLYNVVFKWISNEIKFVTIEFNDSYLIDNNGNLYNKINIYITNIVK
ncbi:MAG TPA: hypothetical protein GX747_04620 [Tenericutes bacterium]|nr:hypothetical protein [Mycoplasmatota bacterium]